VWRHSAAHSAVHSLGMLKGMVLTGMVVAAGPPALHPLVSPHSRPVALPLTHARAYASLPCLQVAIPPPGQDSGLSAASAVLEEVIPFAEVANPVLAQVWSARWVTP
jgi:hypothetical protein